MYIIFLQWVALLALYAGLVGTRKQLQELRLRLVNLEVDVLDVQQNDALLGRARRYTHQA